MSMPTAEKAAELAAAVLASALPRRWRHVQAVGRKAATLGRSLLEVDAESLVAAAWLHDVGYSPTIVDTGLHALDGARWVLRQGFSDRIAALVAHHSCALFEADERGLSAVLAGEFPREKSPTADALWYADMTTGPDGADVEVGQRLAEIRQRYGPDHLVTRFWKRAEPDLMAAVSRTQRLLQRQPM
ncbi:MAG TPA: HD domain-containing protein [Pilimelia sp.]|nr:HD domain-containing protein [Pilimelia sp.]